jgi:hypothetical protein
MWLARHTPEKVMPILHKVLDAAKDEYADAIANGGGIYAAGYCFGAKYVILLAGEHPDTPASQGPQDEEQGAMKKGPFIKAGALAHGQYIILTLSGLEIDNMSSDFGHKRRSNKPQVSGDYGLRWYVAKTTDIIDELISCREGPIIS